MAGVKRGGGESLTQFYSVLLKKGLCCFIQSNVQRNVPVTVHSRERRTLLQQEADRQNTHDAVSMDSVCAASH